MFRARPSCRCLAASRPGSAKKPTSFDLPGATFSMLAASAPSCGYCAAVPVATALTPSFSLAEAKSLLK